MGRSHRVRQRAHAVRLSAKGYTLDQIADVLDVDRDAVSRTLDRWEEGGLAALEGRKSSGPPAQGGRGADGRGARRRPGASRQLTPHAGKKGALGFACYATLRKVLRRARWRWRRTGKPPTPHRVRAARKALAKLRAHEQAGRCDVFSGDESGFCLQSTPGRCWQPPGPTLTVPSQTQARRWNVGGFLRADGELAHLGRAGRLGAREFIEAVETRLLPVLRRPSLLVLDNGPCHRSRLVRAKRAERRRRGLRLFLLPPYCPHLNRIETLWRLVKHHWLPATAYANLATLRESVTSLLNTVGLDYRVSFS